MAEVPQKLRDLYQHHQFPNQVGVTNKCFLGYARYGGIEVLCTSVSAVQVFADGVLIGNVPHGDWGYFSGGEMEARFDGSGTDIW